MAPNTFHRNTVLEETLLANFINYHQISRNVQANKAHIAVHIKREEKYFAPKGSLDRLLRDSRFLSVLTALKWVPRIMSWIEKACSGGCQVCRSSYPEQRRIAISLCCHSMCDACLQRLMGDKMNPVYCLTCRQEILVVLILDRPKNLYNLGTVKDFLLQDDTPVHDPSLKLDSLVSLWRLGKEYPIILKPGCVEPIPASDYTPLPEVKCPEKETSVEDDVYNQKTQELIESMLCHLGTDEEPFLSPSASKLEDGDLIDWNSVFRDDECEQNVNAKLATSRPYKLTNQLIGDVRMDCNFWNLGISQFVKSPWTNNIPECRNLNATADKWESQSSCSDSGSDVTSSSDGSDDQGTPWNLENLLSQLPLNYKPSDTSNYPTSTFISDGKILKRRLECPQWIMRVQIIPVILDSRLDDLIQLE